MKNDGMNKEDISAEAPGTADSEKITSKPDNSTKIKAAVSIFICIVLAIGIFKGISLLRNSGAGSMDDINISEPDWGENSLQGLHRYPAWVTVIGCMKSSLNYFGRDVSLAWLYGGTGHAFMLHVNDQVNIIGPVSWNSLRFFELCRNIGFEMDQFVPSRRAFDLKEKQLKAYEFVQRSIDEGNPCFGWELGIPEFATIYGYDDGHYLFNTIFGGREKKEWKELGAGGSNILFISAIKPVQPAEDMITVRDALDFAVNYSKPSDMQKRYFIPTPGFTAGPEGYDTWIAALEGGTANGMGTAYNAQCWSECRLNALAFLKEARGRLDGRFDSGFNEAIGHYEAVSKNLSEVARLFPFSDPTSQNPMDANVQDKERCSKAVEALKAARDAEKAGLTALSDLLKSI